MFSNKNNKASLNDERRKEMSKNKNKDHDERINEVINEMVAEKAAERREKEMAAENEIKEQANEEVTAVVEKKPGFIGFMKKNNKKIIGGVLLTAGVVGAYFLYKAMTNGSEIPVVDGDLTVDPDVDVPFEEASAVVEA